MVSVFFIFYGLQGIEKNAPWRLSFRPTPKANEKNAAMDDLKNAKRQQEIGNR